MKTLNDFKLLQIARVFDLNFPRTYQIFRRRRSLEMLSAALPRTADIAEAVASARGFLLRKCNEEKIADDCYIP